MDFNVPSDPNHSGILSFHEVGDVVDGREPHVGMQKDALVGNQRKK